MKNDGIVEVKYSFGENEALNSRISFILNEAVHVFRLHADGNWKSQYKPRYANMLAKEIEIHPLLIRKLLNLRDPVVSNITYAAIEINKGASQ